MNVFTQFTDELESVWNSLSRSLTFHIPFSTYAWHKAWYETLGTDYSVSILVNTDASVLIPLVTKDHVAHFSGGEEGGDYLDAVGLEDNKSSAWKEALQVLQTQGISDLDLRNIPADSKTIELFKNVAGATITQEDTTPMISLPSSFDDYLTTLERKNRHELRRKIRRFDESYPDTKLQVKEADETDIPLLLTLMKQDADKRKFLTPEMEEFFLRLPDIVSRNLLQMNLLYQGSSIATTIAFRDNLSILLYNSGYQHTYVGAGFYLKAKAISWAIDNHFSHYNLLQGNERYKYELGGNDYFVYRIQQKL